MNVYQTYAIVVDQRQFGPSIRALPFSPFRKNVIVVPGFYTANKNRSRQTASNSGEKKDHSREVNIENSDQNQSPEVAIPAVSQFRKTEPWKRSESKYGNG